MTPKSARIAKGSRCLAGAPFCEFDSLTDSVAQRRISSSLFALFALLLITFATLDQCTGSGRT